MTVTLTETLSETLTGAVTGPATSRLRLDIAYDGTAFSGWAKQPGLRTVQGELEGALATVFRRFGEPPMLTTAGRTDAGVHALGQVAHCDLSAAQLTSLEFPQRGITPSTRPGSVDGLRRSLNGIAGSSRDLYVSSIRIAPSGFDARFSAVWRRYEYRIADTAGHRNPLLRNNTLWYPARLDGEAMELTAASLVGLHDWASFCKPRDGATTVRTLHEFRWERNADGVLVARLQADAFCHSMARALVGACVAVGAGKLAIDRVVDIREKSKRTSDFIVMPAKGLTLMEVGYPSDGELGARAELTRARR